MSAMEEALDSHCGGNTAFMHIEVSFLDQARSVHDRVTTAYESPYDKSNETQRRQGGVESPRTKLMSDTPLFPQTDNQDLHGFSKHHHFSTYYF